MPGLSEAARKLTVKQRQTLVTVAAGAGMVLLIVGGLFVSDSHRGPRPSSSGKNADVVKNFRTPAAAENPAQTWVATGQANIHQLQQQNTDLLRRLDQMQADLDRIEKSKSSSVVPGSTTPPLPGAIHDAVLKDAAQIFPRTNLPPPPSMTPVSAGNVTTLPPRGRPGESAPLPAIVDVSLSAPASPEVAAKSDAATVPTIRNLLPPGMFTSAVLLSGLDAPTGGLAKTNPLPVLMRLLDNGTLPNQFHSRIRDCFVTGAGYGDLSAERAYIRLESLSCVMKDGKVIATPIEGYIAGEDGKSGLRGVVVSKQGAMIGRAMLAGIASGLGQSLSQSYSTVSTSPLGAVQTVNPDQVFQAGIASGAGKALDKIADFYIQRANELYPVVEVNSARHGDVILTKQVPLGAAFAEAWLDDDEDY